MTEPVQIALITNVTIVVSLVISRIISHFEHKATSVDVKDIKRSVNGGHSETGEIKRRLEALEGKQ